MRKLMFVMILALAAAGATAAEPTGIRFEQGTWKEVLEKARSTGKLVFIDVYTSWCGPCKQMAADVFPLADVGALFNQSFINYKIDAEKGEGVQIAGSFNVKAFPTYLFVDGNGQLVYRSSGSMPAQRFMQEAQVAIREKNDPKPMAAWMAEYEAGKRDKAFMIEYLKKRAAVKAASATLIEELFDSLTAEDLKDKTLLSAMFFFDPAIEYVPKGKLFEYTVAHHAEMDPLLNKDSTPKGISLSLELLQMGMDNYFRNVIVKDKKVDLLPGAVDAAAQVAKLRNEPADQVVVMTKGMVMKFHSNARNEKELILAAQDFVDNGLFKQDVKGMLAADAADYEKSKNAAPPPGAPKDAPRMDVRFEKARRMVSVSYSLRDAAEAIYNGGVQDKDALSKATEWARQANEYLPHFSSGAVYAGMLFKTGRQQEAVDAMTRASQDPILEQAPETRALLVDNIEKLENGKAPKDLWHRR